MVKSYNISFQDLEEYCSYIHLNADISISLNEFIQEKYALNSDVRADLSKIIFDKDHRIDLSKANLANTILDNIDFNGENIVLKGADLRGASTNNAKFSNYINLEGVNFGNIILDRNKFLLCQLKGSLYKPFIPENKKVEVKVTDKILTELLSKKEKDISLNDFIAAKMGLEKDSIIADLSGHVIDASFSNVNISEANITNCQITGEITNLVMRDCKISNTLFHNLQLNNGDLRGVNLISDLNKNSDVGAIFRDDVVFQDGKFSLPNQNIDILITEGLVAAPKQGDDLTLLYGGFLDYKLKIEGNIENDPTYNKNHLNIGDNSRERIKFSRAKFEEYASYCQKTKSEDTKSISEFFNLEPNQIADFSGEDLSNITLTYGKIDNCDFSFCNFAGSKLSSTKFVNCSLIASKFYQEKRSFLFFTFEKNTADLSETSFKDCNLTGADLREVDAYKMNLTNCKAINLVADGINITKGNILNTDLSGASLFKAKAHGLVSAESIWSYSNCSGIELNDAILSRNEFINVTAKGAVFKDATLSFSDFQNGNFSFIDAENAHLDHAKLQSVILEGAKISGMTLTDADIADIKGRIKDDKNVDFATALACEEQIRYAKQQKEAEIAANKERIYKEYCKNIAFATIVIAVSLPLILPMLLPASVAMVVMPILSTPLIITSTVAVVAAGMDYMSSKIGYNLFSKKLADLLGAEAYIKKINQPLEVEVEKYKNGYKVFIEEIKTMPTKEEKIRAESREKYNQAKEVPQLDNNKKKPVKKEEAVKAASAEIAPEGEKKEKLWRDAVPKKESVKESGSKETQSKASKNKDISWASRVPKGKDAKSNVEKIVSREEKDNSQNAREGSLREF